MSSGGISTSADDERAEAEVATDAEDATSMILKFYANTKGRMDVCVNQNWFSVVNDVELYNKEFRQMKARGVKFRIISEITNDNIFDCKKVNEWAEVRHIDSVSGNFGLSETEFIVATSAIQRGKPVTRVACTGIPAIIEHQQYVFDILWNQAIPAGHRITEIEEGVKTDVVKTIHSRERAEFLLLSGVGNAKKEILAAVSSLSFLSHLADIGLLDKMEQAKSNGAYIMMICPNLPDKADDNHEDNDKEIHLLIADIGKYAEVRNMSGTIEGSVFVFDDNEILTMDVDEDRIGGLALFSNSKSLITNYSSVFESFWNERETLHSVMRAKELLESNAMLLTANEQLKVNDRLQKEFINIAAHELRTPIQPILGVMHMYDIPTKAAEEEEDEKEEVVVKKYHMRMIARNADRLARLSSDILDATRIENNSLKLNVQQKVNLVELASVAVEDFRESAGGRIEFVVKSPDGTVFVDADWSRLSQVLANLLRNAAKFTTTSSLRQGTISVTVEKTGGGEARITVADTGSGIDPEVMPRLFQKFASKTDTGSGTGLGLFISKAIVEAHGGRMWAENNPNGKGATFYFTLPL